MSPMSFMSPMSIVFAAGKYVTWGAVNVSVTNLVIVVIMLVVFVLALVLPFPRERADETASQHSGEDRP